MDGHLTGTRPRRPRPDWELVYKRNPVERLKRDKSPLGILDELPALIAAGLRAVAEEDIVRLKWWGLYHDKPKVGTFMLRIKLPGGTCSPASCARSARSRTLRPRRRRALDAPERPAPLARARRAARGLRRARRRRLTTAGGCGDAVRNITGCPSQGSRRRALRRAPVVDEAAAFFYGNPTTRTCRASTRSRSRLRRPLQRARDQLHLARRRRARGREGFGVLVGGGLSSVPRIARDLGVFVPKDEAVEVLRALLDALEEDLRYRVSRVKARLKFMVDDIGPEGMRERSSAARPRARTSSSRRRHVSRPLGVHAQKQAGLSYVGVPCTSASISGDQLIAVADLARASAATSA
jgi:ferredoxin-nitrite reductase